MSLYSAPYYYLSIFRCKMAETKNIDWRTNDISAEANLELGSGSPENNNTENTTKESTSNDSKEEIINQTENTDKNDNDDGEQKLRSVSGETDTSLDPELEAIKQRVKEMEQEAERLKKIQQEVERDVMQSSGQPVNGTTKR